MLKKRVIPVVQIMGNSVVKTVSFNNPRQVGDAAATVKVFSARAADELALIDIGASLNAKEPDYKFVENTAKNCFMPLTIGGGVSSFECAKRIFDAGADKIIIGSLLHNNPSDMEKISAQYGEQAIVASLDCALHDNEIFTYKSSGEIPSFPLQDAVKVAIEMGAGEIFITSITNEGGMNGYDLGLLEQVLKLTSLPVVINGGASCFTDFDSAFDVGASAIAASSVFFWEGLTINEIKSSLKEMGIPVAN